MAIVQSFRELTVWQRAIELSVAVYKLTSGFPRDEIYGLTSQVRLASVSVASNIAGGQGRRTPGEFAQFLEMARDRIWRCRRNWLSRASWITDRLRASWNVKGFQSRLERC